MCQTDGMNGEDNFKVNILNYLKYNGKHFAIYGTDLALNESYEEAVRFLTIAIRYNHDDHRLYFNRAFCLLELDRNEEALRDIEYCIALKRNWSKAYFKKGQILANMNRFVDAQFAYKIAWQLDSNCEETRRQLRGNIYEALIQRGFDPIRAGYGAMHYLNIEEAANALTSGAFETTLSVWRSTKKRLYFNKKNRPLTPITYY